MSLVYSHGEWQIEGEGSERAQLAYASLDGEALVYRLPNLREQDQMGVVQISNRV